MTVDLFTTSSDGGDVGLDWGDLEVPFATRFGLPSESISYSKDSSGSMESSEVMLRDEGEDREDDGTGGEGVESMVLIH